MNINLHVDPSLNEKGLRDQVRDATYDEKISCC